MFYRDQNSMSSFFRLGDVVKGCFYSQARIDDPAPLEKNIPGYDLNIKKPEHCVILTPCCTIGKDNLVAITPLIAIKKDFLSNPYFTEDLTNINREMMPDKTIPPIGWEQMSPSEKQKRLSKGLGYALKYYFIYEGHPLLSEYQLTNSYKTSVHMIDFRCITTVFSKNIQRGMDRVSIML